MKYRNVDPLIAFGSKVISIPPPCMSARWTDVNCRQRGGEGCWRFSIQPRSLCFTHMSGLISRCCNQECSDRKTRGVWENVKLTQMRGQGKQWQGQFQFPISPQIEVNRGARRLNEDIAASDHSSSARHTVPTGHLKRIRHDFNLEEIRKKMKKTWRGGEKTQKRSSNNSFNPTWSQSAEHGTVGAQLCFKSFLFV